MDGYTCTGCGVHTPISYCDIKLGALCQKCKDDWDRACEKEIKILKPETKKIFHNNTFAQDTDLKQLLTSYRSTLGRSLEHDQKLQQIADNFIKEEAYLKEAEGISWINEIVDRELFTSSLCFIWLRSDNSKRFTEVTDLFSRESTKEMLDSQKLSIGIAKGDLGTFCILKRS